VAALQGTMCLLTEEALGKRGGRGSEKGLGLSAHGLRASWHTTFLARLSPIFRLRAPRSFLDFGSKCVWAFDVNFSMIKIGVLLHILSHSLLDPWSYLDIAFYSLQSLEACLS
jgi:hypothetical protein